MQKRIQTIRKIKLKHVVIALIALAIVGGLRFFPIPTKLLIQLLIARSAYKAIIVAETSTLKERPEKTKKARIVGLVTWLLSGAFIFFPRLVCLVALALVTIAVIALLVQEPGPILWGQMDQ